MEYFRNSFVVRTMAFFIAIVLQFDMLDYIAAHLSVHTPSESIEQTIIVDADTIQDDDGCQSFQHARSLKKVRTRIIHHIPHSLYEPILNAKELFPHILQKKIILQEHCSLRTLFCVFRI